LDINVRDLTISTKKGHSLSATQFSGADKNQKTLIISSATGVLQGYYKKFAYYFAGLGYTVYTFDYHGIGKSGSEIFEIKKNNSDLKNWGNVDQEALVTYAKKIEPENKLILLTHSVGGQVLGFNPRYAQIDKIVLVASQSGYWKHFRGFHQIKMWLFWYVLIPVLTPFFGYFPAKRIGLFENLPKPMVYEWMKWGRQKNYMMHYYNKKEYFFDKITVPLLSLSFPRDHFAPKEAVDWLTNKFKNAEVERIHYVPDKHNLPKLRHFGFFRERFKEELWTMTHNWINKT